MRSFLDSVVSGIRCVTPNCRALAPEDNPITVKVLLFGEYTCYHCKTVYRGALVLADGDIGTVIAGGVQSSDKGGDSGSALGNVLDGDGAETKVTKPLKEMIRAELREELNTLELKLEDVPISGKQVTNGDIIDYITSKRK